MPPAGLNYLRGAGCGFAAVSIWASWSVVTRLAVTTNLDASDIVALRFGVAGLLLSPVLVRRGLARDRLGWLGLAVLIALFLVASFLTACGTVVMRRAKLDPLHAAALVSTGSLVLTLPVYLALSGTRLARMPLADFAFQAVFQGVVVTIVALFLYGSAIAALGASRGAAFGALVPALSALFAIPLLGEWPNEAGWAGIALISAGVYLTSGGPLPRRKPRKRHLPALPPSRASELVLADTRGPNRDRNRGTP